MIDSPRPYGPVAAGLLKTLGIDVAALAKRTQDLKFYDRLGLRAGAFFDRETFGADKLVVGFDTEGDGNAGALGEVLRGAPLSELARRQIIQLETAKIDYMPGISSDEKKQRLSRMSYEAFLRDLVHAEPAVLEFYHARTMGRVGSRYRCRLGARLLGFFHARISGHAHRQGLDRTHGFTPAGYEDTGGSLRLHFPDGNATIARLLVRRLIPGAVPGSSVEDVVTARVNYAQLDRPDTQVRLRLNSIAIRARHLGDGGSATRVEVTYLRGGRPYVARARGAILACYNMMIPYLCPELPAAQKDALHKLVKTPLVYSSVALRNWQAFDRLKLYRVYAPGGYHSYFHLNPHVDIGGYRSAKSPQDPILVHMVRTPCKPGLSEHDQNRAGRAELLATSFEHSNATSATNSGGHSRTVGSIHLGTSRQSRSIAGRTAMRPNTTRYSTPELPEAERPYVVGPRAIRENRYCEFGRGGGAYTDSAIDQGHRAAMELLHAQGA